MAERSNRYGYGSIPWAARTSRFLRRSALSSWAAPPEGVLSPSVPSSDGPVEVASAPFVTVTVVLPARHSPGFPCLPPLA